MRLLLVPLLFGLISADVLADCELKVILEDVPEWVTSPDMLDVSGEHVSFQSEDGRYTYCYERYQFEDLEAPLLFEVRAFGEQKAYFATAMLWPEDLNKGLRVANMNDFLVKMVSGEPENYQEYQDLFRNQKFHDLIHGEPIPAIDLLMMNSKTLERIAEVQKHLHQLFLDNRPVADMDDPKSAKLSAKILEVNADNIPKDYLVGLWSTELPSVFERSCALFVSKTFDYTEYCFFEDGSHSWTATGKLRYNEMSSDQVSSSRSPDNEVLVDVELIDHAGMTMPKEPDSDGIYRTRFKVRNQDYMTFPTYNAYRRTPSEPLFHGRYRGDNNFTGSFNQDGSFEMNWAYPDGALVKTKGYFYTLDDRLVTITTVESTPETDGQWKPLKSPRFEYLPFAIVDKSSFEITFGDDTQTFHKL
ncbi:hypothetical protein [Corallincola spongiicola]|uniref:Uncharacterized protein n=1 Tax=Corallincola spongiicola TaxID=2520508 RepID=A0ABY1WN30_9GAMM|nr:hypothetical protein [Corallincola spongiicola]TAA44966.1 hypothetical protein EXY25_12175 [Corallincola spongiicola]